MLKKLEKDAVCDRQPTNVCNNVAFVVNLKSLSDPRDIRADDNGVWNRKGSPVTYISIHESADHSKTIRRRKKLGDFFNHYKITRVYYRHSASPDFMRIITTVEGIQLSMLCSVHVL